MTIQAMLPYEWSDWEAIKIHWPPGVRREVMEKRIDKDLMPAMVGGGPEPPGKGWTGGNKAARWVALNAAPHGAIRAARVGTSCVGVAPLRAAEAEG